MALVLSGSIDISGSMTATTILVSSPGAAGMVSSSAQITELAPLMAYTASLKGAAIVSSSQQIQNYFTFAQTSSANTFYGNITVDKSSPTIQVNAPTGTSGEYRISNGVGTTHWSMYSTTGGSNAQGNWALYSLGKTGGAGNVIDITPAGATTFSSSIGTAALNMNNMASLGSIGGGAIYLPYNSGLFFRTLNGATARGKIQADDSNNLLLNSDNAGNVGIATTAPLSRLHVVGSTISGLFTGNSSEAAGYSGIVLSPRETQTGAGEYCVELRATNTGGTPSYLNPKMELLVQNNNTYLAADRTVKMTITGAGSIGAPSGTNIYNASDIRLKQNILSINGGLDSVLALNPVKFNWIGGFEPSEDGKDMLGFVAQEVQTIVPEAVESFGANSIFVGETEIDNPLRVNEKFLIPVLTKAIQEQQAIIDGLIARIEALESK